MAEQTAIEWCDSTFNPWIGCTRVSPACDDCYAARGTPARALGVVWGPGQPRHRTADSTWEQPRAWQRQAAAFQAQHGRRRRVFCASLADVFDNEVPAQWRISLMKLITETPDLDWLLLTKRIGNAAQMLETAFRAVHHGREGWADNVLPNVWIGATVVNQAEFDRDIGKLDAVPAAVRFLSVEPMLGEIVDHDGWLWGAGSRNGIDWVICGGESGPQARPMHPDWARSLRDQCAAAGAPFLFKQWGEWLPGQNAQHPHAVEVDGQAPRKVAHHQDGSWGSTDTKVTAKNYVTWGADGIMHAGPVNGMRRVEAWAERVGKRAAGRLLDGVEHNGFPEVGHG